MPKNTITVSVALPTKDHPTRTIQTQVGFETEASVEDDDLAHARLLVQRTAQALAHGLGASDET